MRKYKLNEEMDWKWLMKFLEAEMTRQILLYHRRGEEDSPQARRDYIHSILSFYLSLRRFLKLSPITKAWKRAEEFIEKGPESRW